MRSFPQSVVLRTTRLPYLIKLTSSRPGWKCLIAPSCKTLLANPGAERDVGLHHPSGS
jgi:hypothetical protein